MTPDLTHSGSVFDGCVCGHERHAHCDACMDCGCDEFRIESAVPKGQCRSGKRVYYKERLANRAVTEAAKRGELPPMRHYACPDCGYWHLSRKNVREGAVS